jgi:hypothetical protein
MPGKAAHALLFAVWLAALMMSFRDARAATPEYAAELAADRPLAHWRLAERATAIAADASGNRRDGRYSTGSSQFRFARLVTAGDFGVEFLGANSKIQVPHAVAFNARQLTLEALFTWRGRKPYRQRVLERPSRSPAEPAYALGFTEDGRIVFELRTSRPNVVTSDVRARERMPAHVAATYDGALARIYLNGELVKSAAVVGAIDSSGSQPMVLGNGYPGGRAINGTLDEIAIFASALSAARVRAHAAAGVIRRVPLRIDTPVPSARAGERPLVRYLSDSFPVQLGVPIPEGELHSPTRARLIGPNGAVETAQMKVLGRWRKLIGIGPAPAEEAIPIKWLQVSFNARLNALSSSAYYLEYGPLVQSPIKKPLLTRVGDDVLVDTGPLRFRVDRSSPRLLEQVWLDLNGDGRIEEREAVLARASPKKGLYFIDQSNRVWLGSAAALEVEDSGPHQVTLKLTGRYRSGGQRGADDNEWIVRIKAYANKPFLRIYHTIVFNSSSERRRYKDIGIELPLANLTAPSVRFARGSIRPRVYTPDQPEYLDNGLGQQWWITPAIGAGTRQVMLHQARHNLYRVYVDGRESSNHGHHRSGHWFDVSGASAAGTFGVTAAIRWTWQNYPTGFEWERSASGRDSMLRVHFWTRRAAAEETEGPRLLDFRPIPYLESRGRLPASEFGGAGARDIFRDQISARCAAAPYEIPAGLPARPGSQPCKGACMHADGVGLAKTHEIVLQFHREQLTPGASPAPETAFFLQKPVLAHVSPEWLRDSLALGRLHPKDATYPEIDGNPVCKSDADCGRRKCKADGRCQNFLDVHMDRYLLEQAVDGADRPPYGPTYPLDVPPDSSATRLWGDSYGAFDFGDILHKGKRAHRYWLHNRYFTPSVFWLWYARGGDRRAFEFGESNARHVMDIDTTHTEYDFEYKCGTPPRYPGKRRVFRGTPRVGDIGAIHWASSRPNAFACELRPAPRGGCERNPRGVQVPMFTVPADYASYLTTYYYLTGYERARDVAAEVADYIGTMARRPEQEYWRQTESRGLGAGLKAASDLYELFGGPWLETAAARTALDLIGMADGGRELAANRVSPPPALPGVAYGFGTPLDSSLTHMFAGAIAYLGLATEGTSPKRSDVARWLRDQVDAIAHTNMRQWPNGTGNHWLGMAAAFHESGNPATLGVGLDDFERVKASGWDDSGRSYQRSLTLFSLPYLMGALARPSQPVVRQVRSFTSGAELRVRKEVSEDVTLTLKAAATPYAALPLYPVRTLPNPPFLASSLPPAVPRPRDGEPRLCVAPCSAAMVVFGPAGGEIARRPYPASHSSARSRVWYNAGGWIERVLLRGPPGIYRARVEVQGVETGRPVLKGDRVVEIAERARPLFQLYAPHRQPGKVTPLAAAATGARAPLSSPGPNGQRYPFGFSARENCSKTPTPAPCTTIWR